jgi:hypothetical protein
MGTIVVGPLVLDLHIRHERRALQLRAKQFLARPIPKLLLPDSDGFVGGHYEGTNGEPANDVLGYTRPLVSRYADKGRIRWSARIQGEFASTSSEIWVGAGPDGEAIETNEEVRRYMAERNAILGKEWQMGFWQWVEDVMELKQTIPEIEEEDQDARYVQQFDGTWTNADFDTMTIEPGGRFTFNRSNRFHTNHYAGTWTAIMKGPALRLTFTAATGAQPQWSVGEEAEFRILHLDEHSLIYEVNKETNQMRRRDL